MTKSESQKEILDRSFVIRAFVIRAAFGIRTSSFIATASD